MSYVYFLPAEQSAGPTTYAVSALASGAQSVAIKRSTLKVVAVTAPGPSISPFSGEFSAEFGGQAALPSSLNLARNFFLTVSVIETPSLIRTSFRSITFFQSAVATIIRTYPRIASSSAVSVTQVRRLTAHTMPAIATQVSVLGHVMGRRITFLQSAVATLLTKQGFARTTTATASSPLSSLSRMVSRPFAAMAATVSVAMHLQAKPLSIAVFSFARSTKIFGNRTTQAVADQTAGLLRVLARPPLLVATSPIAAFNQSRAFVAVAIAAQSAVLSRGAGKALSASASALPAPATKSVLFRSFVLAVTVFASAKPASSRFLSATANSATSLARIVGVPLQALARSAIAMMRQTTRSSSVTVSPVTALTLATSKIIQTSASGVSSIARAGSRIIQAAVNVAANFGHAFTKLVPAAASQLTSVVRGVARSLISSASTLTFVQHAISIIRPASSTPAVSTNRFLKRSLAVLQGPAAGLSRSYNKGIAAAFLAISSLLSAGGRIYSAVAGANASSIRSTLRTSLADANTAVTFSVGSLRRVLAAAASSTLPVLARGVARSIRSNVAAAAALSRGSRLTFFVRATAATLARFDASIARLVPFSISKDRIAAVYPLNRLAPVFAFFKGRRPD